MKINTITYDEVKTVHSFRKFLVKTLSYELIEEFLDNLKNSGNTNKLNVFCKGILPTNYFYRAFTWSDTPSGYDVWSRINTKWLVEIGVFNVDKRTESITSMNCIKPKKSECKSIW